MKGHDLKVTKGNIELLIEAGKDTQFGPNWPGERCLAKTRSGSQCQKPALTGRNRCQLHGGKTPRHVKPTNVDKRPGYFQEVQKIKNWARANGFSTDL